MINLDFGSNLYLEDPGPDLDRVRQLVSRYSNSGQANPVDIALLATVAPQWITGRLNDDKAKQAQAAFAQVGARVSVQKGRRFDLFGGPHDVILESPGPQRIKTMKVVRAYTDLDLASAKQLVEACPATIATGLDSRRAAQAVIDFRQVGAEARLTGLEPNAETVPAANQPRVVTDGVNPATGRFCTECGTPVQPSAKFCISCGQKLLTAASSSATIRSSLSPVHDEQDPDLVAGLVHYDSKMWTEAEPLLRKAAERGNVTATFKLANTLEYLGRLDEAVPLWEVACSWGHAGAQNNYGNWLQAQERYDEAIQFLQSAAESGEPRAMFNLGVLYLDLLNFEAAELWLTRAIELGLGRAAAVWGKRLIKRGFHDEGMAILMRGAQLGNLSACLGLADVARERGDYSEMVQWTRAALTYADDPQEQHQVGRAWAFLGIGLCLNNQPLEAIEPLETALPLLEGIEREQVVDLLAEAKMQISSQPELSYPSSQFRGF